MTKIVMNAELPKRSFLWSELSTKERQYALQLSVIFFAQIVDIVTTAIALHIGASEGNPLMRKIIQQGGIELFSVIKILATVGIIALIEIVRRIFNKRKLSEWYVRHIYDTSLAINIVMSIVVINNLTTILNYL